MGDDGPLRARLVSIVDKHDKLRRASTRAPNHLGTLGTGNHFIEVCLDEADRVWVMLHSGSRGIGNSIGSYFIERAKQHMHRWFINLPDADLAYLPEGTNDFDDYVEAVGWAQDFAMANRQICSARRCRLSTVLLAVKRPSPSSKWSTAITTMSRKRTILVRTSW